VRDDLKKAFQGTAGIIRATPSGEPLVWPSFKALE